jgi:PAS domain S-box-containing protein
MGLWHLFLISVVASEILTGIIVGIMSIIFRGRVTYDYLITGAVTSLIVATLVVSVILFFVKQLRKTQEALRESEEKYRIILSSIEDSYFEVNQRGEITFFNEAFSEITGYPPDELMGMKNDKYLDQENRKKVFKKFNEVWKTGIPTKLFEYELIRKNGEKRTVQTSASLVTDENGQKIGFRGIIRDVSDRKLIENALKKSERSLKRAQRISKIGSWDYDWNSETEVWSEGCFELYGINGDDYPNNIVPESLSFSIYENPEETDKLSALLAKKHDTYEIEFTTVPINDQVKIIHSYCEVEKDNDGNILKVFGTDQDITERKKAEEVSKKADALEVSNVILNNFVGDALGNLMSPIYGRIQMVSMKDNIDEIKSELKHAETGLAEFLTGINAFRKYFRFGERPMKERSSTDISHILSTLLSGQVLETYGKDEFPIYSKVKLRFTYDSKQEEALDLKELPYVVGHESDITTAIQETLINAIESYDPEKGGEVVVSAKRENDYLILEIADKGRGMSPGESEKSQLPFYKILGVKDSTRFGLGAYIARGSAKYCGGDIHIESTEGVGTTASVLFKISNKPLVDI